MLNGILGKKLEMMRVFKEDGRCVVVTAISAGPCRVLQVKSKPREGYTALQLGYQDVPARCVAKPQRDYFAKLKIAPQRFIREIRSDSAGEFKPGDSLNAGIFAEGDFVDITGVSKGKGFQGGMKRWHWSGGPDTHGSMSHRRPGSIGASAFPSRVIKGAHMAGRMGGDTVTIQNLEVVKIDEAQNLIFVKGAVPGHRNSLLVIRRSKKKPFKQPAAKEQAAPREEKKPDKEAKPKAGERKEEKKDAKKETKSSPAKGAKGRPA